MSPTVATACSTCSDAIVFAFSLFVVPTETQVKFWKHESVLVIWCKWSHHLITLHTTLSDDWASMTFIVQNLMENTINFWEHLECANTQIHIVSRIGSLPELCIYLAFNFCITFHLHYICISFTFRIAPRIDIFALHFINISKCQINVK